MLSEPAVCVFRGQKVLEIQPVQIGDPAGQKFQLETVQPELKTLVFAGIYVERIFGFELQVHVLEHHGRV